MQIGLAANLKSVIGGDKKDRRASCQVITGPTHSLKLISKPVGIMATLENRTALFGRGLSA